MPMYSFFCSDCKHKQEHFMFNGDQNTKQCPNCESSNYKKMLSRIKVNIEYKDNDENYKRKIEPHVKDTYERIGREAMSGDTNTLENVFGSQKVNNTFGDNS